MRLLSYNIHKGFGGRDRRYQFQRIIDVIEHENPDIICLQEVDCDVSRSQFDHQPDILKNYFHYLFDDYQLNVKLKRGGYGNFMMSRFPVLSVDQVCLKLSHRKKRGAQVAVIDTFEGPFQLVHWHLGLAEKQRQQQVAHLLNHQDYLKSADHPSIIVGDFNDWRDNLENALLTEAGYSQKTRPLSRYRSFPAYLPVGALDKAFIRGDVRIKEVRLSKTSLTREASDHLPLIIDFHLSQP